MDEFQDLLSAAAAARDNAYAPYSRFRVGAALRARSGAIYVGCNVENASFPLGSCAEAGAIAAMAAAGDRRIADILVLGPQSGPPTAPCGACRQRILEFADPRTRIILAASGNVRAVYSCPDLLPNAFALPRPQGPDFEPDHD